MAPPVPPSNAALPAEHPERGARVSIRIPRWGIDWGVRISRGEPRPGRIWLAGALGLTVAVLGAPPEAAVVLTGIVSAPVRVTR